MPTWVPVLEIGGTHVTSARVDATAMTVDAANVCRFELDSGGTAQEILSAFTGAAAALPGGHSNRWGVAVPAPFDYARGVAWFTGVGKFEALHGLDVRVRLMASIHPRPEQIVFVNDADAFVLGEWVSGSARGTDRCMGLTLGTGVGSGFIADGTIVGDGPDVPPEGSVHRILWDGQPLEETVSRRAIRRAYAAASGDTDADVAEISERARAENPYAVRVLTDAMHALGSAVAPYVGRFAPELVVVGGSMSRSWPLLEPWFVAGCEDVGVVAPPTAVSADAEAAALTGAAYAATLPIESR